jgi:hypothetical protein
MNTALKQYIQKARSKGRSDDEIKHDMIEGGWDPRLVDAGIKGDDDLVVPPPPAPAGSAKLLQQQPTAQQYTSRGLEYVILFIALAVSALSLGSILNSTVNNVYGGGDSVPQVASFATAALVVSLPIFALLFLRLKRAEARDPELLRNHFPKRSMTMLLIITFLIGIGNIIYFVYSIITNGTSSDSYNWLGSQSATDILGNFMHLLVTLVIAGSIFAYYWRELHRKA